MSLQEAHQSSPVANESSRKAPSQCSVCYRPADGYHCDVASCKACKTFFRRTLLSNNVLICKLNQDCFDQKRKLNLNIRCQSCRYEKCLQVGMNPSALQFSKEEEKSLKSKVPNFNEQIKSIRFKESFANDVLEKLDHCETMIETLRLSVHNPSLIELGSLKNMIQHESLISSADKLKPMPGWPFPKQMIKSRETESNPRQYSAERKIWLSYNTFTTIEYAKTFSFFNQLNLEDRFTLAGHVILICMQLHMAYFAVSRKFDGCLQPDGTESPRKLDCNYKTTAMSVAPLMRCNIQYTEYLLLKAICFCNPTVHDLSGHAQTILTQKRNQYGEILFDYCLKTRSNGPSRFSELLGIIPVLEQQQLMKKTCYILMFAPRLKGPEITYFMNDIMFS